MKYKKNLSKQAVQTSSSSRSFSSTSSNTKSTASESKKVNPWTEEDSAALRQEILLYIKKIDMIHELWTDDLFVSDIYL